jgi:hypothetical protein
MLALDTTHGKASLRVGRRRQGFLASDFRVSACDHHPLALMSNFIINGKDLLNPLSIKSGEGQTQQLRHSAS